MDHLYENWVTIAPDSREFLCEVDVETAKIAPLTDSVSEIFYDIFRKTEAGTHRYQEPRVLTLKLLAVNI